MIFVFSTVLWRVPILACCNVKIQLRRALWKKMYAVRTDPISLLFINCFVKWRCCGYGCGCGWMVGWMMMNRGMLCVCISISKSCCLWWIMDYWWMTWGLACRLSTQWGVSNGNVFASLHVDYGFSLESDPFIDSTIFYTIYTSEVVRRNSGSTGQQMQWLFFFSLPFSDVPCIELTLHQDIR